MERWVLFAFLLLFLSSLGGSSVVKKLKKPLDSSFFCCSASALLSSPQRLSPAASFLLLLVDGLLLLTEGLRHRLPSHVFPPRADGLPPQKLCHCCSPTVLPQNSPTAAAEGLPAFLRRRTRPRPPQKICLLPSAAELVHFVIWIIIVGILWFSLKDLLSRLLEGLMGGNTSKEDPRRRSIPPSSLSSHNSESYSHSYPGHGQQPYAPQPYPSHPLHTGQVHFQASSSQSSQAQTDVQRKKLQRTYSRIADNYKSLEQVTEALAEAGLESSNLIVGIDFTKSNEWTGRNSFQRRSLHHLGDTQNPYEQAISIIGRTLSSFDEDNLIPCFGFGDASTHDQDVFSFYPDERPCNGFEEALSRYRELVPHLRLAGPTSFAPIIEMAITIVEQSGGQYHVLLIIADGQVTRSVDTGSGQWSSQEQKTVDAIVQASHYPLSIVVVGVGDGPWDMMREFDDNIPSRSFDNFQFVNFTDIMLKNVSQTRRETEFALAALMEIPSQYKATLELGLLGHSTGKSPDRVSLPTPGVGYRMPTYNPKTTQSTSLKKSAPPYPRYDAPDPVTTATSAGETATFDNQVCPICLTNPKDMAFGCGHQTCCDCGQTLESCPICRCSIQTRIKLY